MKNRYLFRGKQTDNREWVVGNLIQNPFLDKVRSWISSEQNDKARLRLISKNQALWRAIEVDSSTICQCTGFKDKSNKLVWENDIIRTIYDGIEKIYIVKWDESELDFKATNGKENYSNNFEYLTCCEEVEIIGNIFDNPDLVSVIQNCWKCNYE